MRKGETQVGKVVCIYLYKHRKVGASSEEMDLFPCLGIVESSHHKRTPQNPSHLLPSPIHMSLSHFLFKRCTLPLQGPFPSLSFLPSPFLSNFTLFSSFNTFPLPFPTPYHLSNPIFLLIASTQSMPSNVGKHLSVYSPPSSIHFSSHSLLQFTLSLFFTFYLTLY